MQSNKKEKLRKATHLLAGSVILLHALGQYEAGQGTYIYFLLSGLIFLSVALFHHTLKARFPWVDTIFFGIEGILSFLIAYEYFHLGKNALGCTYIFAGSLQLIAIFIFARRLNK